MFVLGIDIGKEEIVVSLREGGADAPASGREAVKVGACQTAPNNAAGFTRLERKCRCSVSSFSRSILNSDVLRFNISNNAPSEFPLAIVFTRVSICSSLNRCFMVKISSVEILTHFRILLGGNITMLCLIGFAIPVAP